MRDIYNIERRYNRILDRIKHFTPKKRREFKRFHKHLVMRDISIIRRITLLSNLNEVLDERDIKPPTEHNIYLILAKIERKHKSPNTIRDYKIAYRSYLQSLNVTKELIELIRVGNPQPRRPRCIIRDPNIWQNMETHLEQLFVRLLQETGLRPGEILSLRFCDIEYTDFGANLTVTGKTGTRTIPITDSAKMLLTEHKKAKNEEDLVFWFTYDRIRRKIRIMLEKQGYKDRYMYLFRKSRATLFFADLPEQIVKKYMGWTKGSKMAEVYSFIPQEMMTEAVLAVKQQEHHKPEQKTLSSWA